MVFNKFLYMYCISKKSWLIFNYFVAIKNGARLLGHTVLMLLNFRDSSGAIGLTKEGIQKTPVRHTSSCTMFQRNNDPFI